LRFVADESCDFAVVRALRGAGFDVWAVAEQAPQSSDPEVLGRALEAQSVLVTEDKDFGWLVYASGRRSQGVILLRGPRRRAPREPPPWFRPYRRWAIGCTGASWS
jgi:predicted nuclease of predicted toxin-antitoxin system